VDGFRWHGQPVVREFGRMGKSLKNSVNPDELYGEYGADTFRLYEMSMAPLDVSRPWETRAVVDMFRFLHRLRRNLVDEQSGVLRVHERPADDTIRPGCSIGRSRDSKTEALRCLNDASHASSSKP